MHFLRPQTLLVSCLLATTALAQTWVQEVPPTTPPVGGSNEHAMVYDSARGQVVLFAGLFGGGIKTWEWNGTDWEDVATSSTPSIWGGAAMAFDPVRNVTVLHGGFSSGGPSAETWEYDGVDWTLVNVTGPALGESTMCFDASTNRLVLVGGSDLSGNLSTDTWEYDPGSGVWSLIVSPSSPTVFNQMALDFDPIAQRVVLFGGQTTLFGLSDETWLYDSSSGTWTQASPSQSPVPRRGTRGVFVPAFAGVVIHGGFGGGQLADTWLYDSVTDTWVEVIGANGPAVDTPLLAYDAARAELVLQGGFEGAPAFASTDDTWTLPLGACGTLAQATFRADSAGVNLTNFAATAPVWGGSWTASVDNTGTGASLAWVVGYKNALDVQLGFGSVLVDASTAELLNFAPQATTGIASFAALVPNTPSLCGFTFTAQGVSLAPGTILPSNAYDLTIGL